MSLVEWTPGLHLELVDNHIARHFQSVFDRKSIRLCRYGHGGWCLVDVVRKDVLDEIWPIPADNEGRPFLNKDLEVEIKWMVKRPSSAKEDQQLVRRAHKDWMEKQDAFREHEAKRYAFMRREFSHISDHPSMQLYKE